MSGFCHHLSTHAAFGLILCGLAACDRAPVSGNEPATLATVTKAKIGLELIGTGFLIDRAGHVLTADHAVANCVERFVTQGDTTLAADLLAQSPADDLALLKVDGPLGEPAVFARTIATAGRGMVFAASYQSLQEMLARGGVLSNAVIAESDRQPSRGDIVLLSEASFGSSGAPVLSAGGLVLGVITHRQPPDRVSATNADQAKIFVASRGIAFAEGDQSQLGALQDRARFAAKISVRVTCFR
jgi:S1-C subfamily serine protease